MTFILALRVISNLGTLIFGVALSEGFDCEAARENCRCKDDVSFQGADVGLLALMNAMKLLYDRVNLVERVFNLVVCIRRG